ncbi:MAG: sodium:proton antiporter [Bacteroidota bacterium]
MDNSAIQNIITNTTPLNFITVLVILAAFFLLMNVRYLKLPSTIGLMILALSMSLFILFGEYIFSALLDLSQGVMQKFEFEEVLFQVMLSFLLFAGALEMNLHKLGEEKWMILILATVGVMISTFVVGTTMFYVLPVVNLQVEYIYCLLFGALISPTDPIAVLAMIKKSHVSKNLESQIAGESLFNDGIGVVVFTTIMAIITSTAGGHGEAAQHGLFIGDIFGVHDKSTVLGVSMLFSQEVIGGIALGALIGYIGLWLLIVIPNEYTEIEVLVTLSMVMGGATIAHMIHVSGPLAMVVMGLFVGNQGRSAKLSDVAGEYVYKFWHLMDEAMNAILFILIGMQILIIEWSFGFILAALIAIAVVLLGRFLGVSIPTTFYRLNKKVPKYTIRILTWSGLRGGISVALALSLAELLRKGGVELSASRMETVDLIVVMTYCIVLFSIVVQGLTVGKLFAKAENNDVEEETTAAE